MDLREIYIAVLDFFATRMTLVGERSRNDWLLRTLLTVNGQLPFELNTILVKVMNPLTRNIPNSCVVCQIGKGFQWLACTADCII
jgi:hypothetical protein